MCVCVCVCVCVCEVDLRVFDIMRECKGVISTFSCLVAEQALKARKEIADYIKSGRIERARIRVS